MPNIELPQAEYKIVVLGDTNTGKTSLVLRFVEGYYRSESNCTPTVGAFFLTKRITIHNNITCKLLLWDTAGQVQFQKLAKTYYNDAAVTLLTYDVTNHNSIDTLKYWLDEIQTNIVYGGGQQHYQQTYDHNNNKQHKQQQHAQRRIVIAIVACKGDLEPVPGIEEEAQHLATSVNAIYMKTSAKDNINIHKLFKVVSERVLEYHNEYILALNNSTTLTTKSNSSKNLTTMMLEGGSSSSSSSNNSTSAGKKNPYGSAQHLRIPVKVGGVVANVQRSRSAAASATRSSSMATATTTTKATNAMTNNNLKSSGKSKSGLSKKNSSSDNNISKTTNTTDSTNPTTTTNDGPNSGNSIFSLNNTPFRKNRSVPLFTNNSDKNEIHQIHSNDSINNNKTTFQRYHNKLFSSLGSAGDSAVNHHHQQQQPETESSSDGSDELHANQQQQLTDEEPIVTTTTHLHRPYDNDLDHDDFYDNDNIAINNNNNNNNELNHSSTGSAVRISVMTRDTISSRTTENNISPRNTNRQQQIASPKRINRSSSRSNPSSPEQQQQKQDYHYYQHHQQRRYQTNLEPSVFEKSGSWNSTSTTANNLWRGNNNNPANPTQQQRFDPMNPMMGMCDGGWITCGGSVVESYGFSNTDRNGCTMM